MVHLAFGRLWLERLGKHVVDLRCFLGSQIFKRAEVKLMKERIGLPSEHAPAHRSLILCSTNR